MKQSHQYILIALVGLIGFPSPVHSANEASRQAPENKAQNEIFYQNIEECYLDQLEISEGNRKAEDIIKWCQAQFEVEERPPTPLQKRISREKATMENPSVITPHRRNYILPVTYVEDFNTESYVNEQFVDSLDNVEVKFQLSFKAPLWDDIFSERDALMFGFTLQSYWQMYNSDISSPFRETNYQPEIFYAITNDYNLAGWTNRANMFGIEHQSNGRSLPQSRSWNRVFAQFVWENEQWVISFRPWYRLPEDEKTGPTDPKGDDNPDIDKYMGYFELSSGYKYREHNFGIMLRNNLWSDSRGAVQLDWTFPMGSRFRGYLQYFNGYGESLIDYNHSVERLGFGLTLTDLF